MPVSWRSKPVEIVTEAIMRVAFFIALFINIALLAWGQGFFGTPPSELGREPRFLNERNQQAITIGSPKLANTTPRPAAQPQENKTANK